MTQPQPLQLVPTARPLPERIAAMTRACSDVSGLSAGFALDGCDGLDTGTLADWFYELSDAARRLDDLLIARQAADDEAGYAAMARELEDDARYAAMQGAAA